MSHKFFNPFPKYLQVAEILRGRIEREFKKGDQIPTEGNLCAQFGVSRETIREALHLLETEGLLNRQRGRGTFVTKCIETRGDNRLTGLSEDLYKLRENNRWKVLEKRPATTPGYIASLMRIPIDEITFRIVRLQIYNREPLAYHESHVQLEYGISVAKSDLQRMPIIVTLQQSLNIKCREEHQRIEAVVADTLMASMLDVKIGAPLLLMTRLFLDKQGDAVVAFRTHYRADRYYYSLKLPKETQHK